MLSQLQASYQRMEHSLQRLTDSIAAYNPSTVAADELVAADDALSEDLERLIQHQRNVLRIRVLEHIAKDNDERIKNHFQAVAELRKDLMAIPSTETSSNIRDVSVDELLSYARFISQTTVPPTFRKQDVSLKTVEPKSADAQITNGIATPPPGAQEVENQPSIKSSNVGAQAMTEPEEAWLNPLANLPFAPWPELPVIANGALGDIQRMVEQGRDPASVLSAEEQAEAERKRREEEERERLEEEERQRRRMSMFDTVGRRRTREEQSDVFDPDA